MNKITNEQKKFGIMKFLDWCQKEDTNREEGISAVDQYIKDETVTDNTQMIPGVPQGYIMHKPYGIEADLLKKWQHAQKQIKELQEECRLLSELVSSQDDCLATLEQQNAELVAQIGSAKVHTIDGTCYVKCVEIFHDSHKRALANIKADAIEEAIGTSAKVQTYGEDNKCIRVATLQEHIKELREQAK